jgi:hypothetical protein
VAEASKKLNLSMKYSRTSQDKIVFFFLTIFFLTTTLLACFSNGTYESGDSIQHYLIARYSFSHPQLFFDHWGKPFFTLLASPFAQFGFVGICFFNISCATATGFISYEVASRLTFDRPWLAPIFALFAPIYYVTLVSGLTEPLFALLILTGVLFCMDQKFSTAALIVSFLPFVRSEGFLVLFLFALVFIVNRKYFGCLILITGTALYSITGFFHYHNILWVLNENPYKDAKQIFGSGSLFHFIGKNEFILGTPLVVLFCFGIISYFIRKKKNSFTEIVLIPGIFFIYLAAHSVIWWKGLYSSSGLIRVLAGVTPLAGLVALRGFDLFLGFLSKLSPVVKNSVAAIVIVLIILMPFKQHQFPRPLGYDDIVVKQVADWIKEKQTATTKYYYQYPYLSVFLNVDPFDENKYIPLWSMQREHVPAGSIVVWDNHYGPNESRLPLNSMTSDSTFELLNTFKGDPAKTPGDKELFEVYVFKKN